MTRENHYDILTLLAYGGVAEWFKAPVLKTGDSARDRGFESHLLRHIEKRAVAQATALFFVQDGPLQAAGMGLPAASPYGVGVRDPWFWRAAQRAAPTDPCGTAVRGQTDAAGAAARPVVLYPPFARAGVSMPSMGGGLAAHRAAFSFKSICPWQMVSFGGRRWCMPSGRRHCMERAALATLLFPPPSSLFTLPF